MFHLPLARLLLGAALAFMWSLTFATPPASAHTGLISTDPADGQEMTTAPDNVSLTFTDQMSGEFNSVTLTVDRGKPVVLDAQTTKNVVSAAIPLNELSTPTAVAADVSWTIFYRVVSADGHPVTGEVTFTAPLPVNDTPSRVAQSPDASAEATPNGPPADDVSPSSDAEADPQGIPWTAIALVAGLVIILVAGLAGVLLRKRTRGRTTNE